MTPVENDRAPRKSNPVFKSPTTPASAHPRTPSTLSPSIPRSFPGQSAPTDSLAAPAHAVLSQSFNNPAAQIPQHASHFQSHFFAQSSGNWMPPLESSCSFLLASISYLSFLFLIRTARLIICLPKLTKLFNRSILDSSPETVIRRPSSIVPRSQHLSHSSSILSQHVSRTLPSTLSTNLQSLPCNPILSHSYLYQLPPSIRISRAKSINLVVPLYPISPEPNVK